MQTAAPLQPAPQSASQSASQNSSRRHVVIMAGGRGERFWPQSRSQRPKHLLPIVGTKPLLAQTLDRLADLAPPENFWVITNREQRAAVLATCPALPAEQVIGEPCGRDTAAVVALAAALVERKQGGAATLALLPADAVIHDTAGFQHSLAAAFAAAEADAGNRLVTVGIKPTAPATGYGYIHKGERISRETNGESSGKTAAEAAAAAATAATSKFCASRSRQEPPPPLFAVRQFVEKPDLQTAQRYLASGEFLWNAGIFVWTTHAIAAAFQKHEPALWNDVHAITQKLDTAVALDDALDAIYPALKKISIDYAILEKAENVACVPAAFDWDDVGEWPALARHARPDANGNTLRGETALLDAANNILISTPDHLIAALGIEDLIIVHTPDATLICPKARAQELKHLVATLPKKFTA
jgi:mannose-1-phosphate guanylyltransferase